MSQENNNLDIFNEDVEEGEITERNMGDEEEKEDDEDENWGGAPVAQNETIIPNMVILSTVLGINQIVPPLNIPASPSTLPQSGRIRRREEVESPSHPNKSYRNSEGKRVTRERTSQYSYLILKSGEEFHFKEEDSSKTLLNDIIEPNRLIRNIISNVPERMIERIEYLAKFKSEEDTDSDEENCEKVKRRYFGNLKDLVYEAYIKEWRLRFLFKRVLVLWRTYKMIKSSEKEVDPINIVRTREGSICI